MINLDLTKLAPEIVALLVRRGSGLPSLAWHDRNIPPAKSALDQIDDTQLFDSAALADEGMVAAVRAMLYLWNGWPDDCKMYAQAAGQSERHLLTGICDRQAGNAVAAKNAFQQIDGHPIFASLASYLLEVIGVKADARVRRFVDIVKLGETWEPFAFIDLFEQVRAGKLCKAAEEAVRSVQCREFELLFNHCYQGATGHSVEAEQRPAAGARPKRDLRRTRRPIRPPRNTSTPFAAKPAGPAKRPLVSPPSMVIGVLCPKCATMKRVAKTARGKRVRCDKCGTGFVVPRAKADGRAARAPQ